MKRMIEKMFVNDDLEIELTSFIDDKQNVWFRGKDVARILGYSDTDQAIRKNLSKDHKIIHLNLYTGQKNVPPPNGLVNKMTLEGNGAYSLMRLAFMNLYLVQN